MTQYRIKLLLHSVAFTLKKNIIYVMRYDTDTINAVVLAGGLNYISLFDGYRPGYKALLPFRQKPAIQYTLNALKSTPQVKRICIVGPVSEIKKSIISDHEYEYVEAEDTLIENIQKGLDHYLTMPIVLVVPSDLPLVTPYAITRFLDACKEVDTSYESSVLWSMVPEENFTGPYRKEKDKGFNRFRDISVCHGNLLLITPVLLQENAFTSRIEKIYNARKSSIRAALAVGPLTGLTYLIGVHLLRVLTVAQFARITSCAFGVSLVPVIVNDPDIAIDIDEARDYKFIGEELERRGKQEIRGDSLPMNQI